MYTYYFLAKLIENYKNPIFVILLLKQCKRLADCEQFYAVKMKAYKGLGQAFLNVRANLALLYLTKYLMSAWKLDDGSCELQAYDLLGKYYFYVGDAQKALLFHQKMAKGHHEHDRSALKRLAVAKLNSGSLNRFKHEQARRVNIEEPEFAVSSDEEVFDVLFKHDAEEEKREEARANKISGTKRSVLKFPLRHLPKFDSQEEDGRRM